ncbi:MAG: hypothetical protein COC19_00710 [SAR86 cluster bacterium]|uniref:Uncharacterized protein n=1 Tax=SAR86 cluster bacterium TaxID=2030880 RepID=A0A2A4MV56_9GAMM|nr:MAG: hypothetical protein COC19_00710 [SAR86 cluster bacterium]
MKKQQLVAVIISLVVVAWMLIPRGNDSTSAESSESARPITVVPENQATNDNSDLFTIRAAAISPQSYIEQVRVRGRTQAFRHVQIRAEAAGRVVATPVVRGQRVSEGDVLCEIDVDSRATDLTEAQSRLEQVSQEYNAAQDLQQRSLLSTVELAQKKSALDSAMAALNRANLALEKIKIRSPFDGVVETRIAEIGDLLNLGGVCASVLDDSPMLLVGLVPENDIGKVSLGAEVSAVLLTGENVSGRVTYLARAADAISRSYRIEVEIDARHEQVREGITAELMVRAAEITAHLIPASALTLDDNGGLGVKLVGSDKTVRYQLVHLVGDNSGQLSPGMWVTGLQGTVTLITHGQEIVFDGQQVESDFEWSQQ